MMRGIKSFKTSPKTKGAIIEKKVCQHNHWSLYTRTSLAHTQGPASQAHLFSRFCNILEVSNLGTTPPPPPTVDSSKKGGQICGFVKRLCKDVFYYSRISIWSFWLLHNSSAWCPHNKVNKSRKFSKINK